MCVPNLVPIGPQTATRICLEGYTRARARVHAGTHAHTHTHPLLYIDSIREKIFIGACGTDMYGGIGYKYLWRHLRKNIYTGIWDKYLDGCI